MALKSIKALLDLINRLHANCKDVGVEMGLSFDRCNYFILSNSRSTLIATEIMIVALSFFCRATKRKKLIKK